MKEQLQEILEQLREIEDQIEMMAEEAADEEVIELDFDVEGDDEEEVDGEEDEVTFGELEVGERFHEEDDDEFTEYLVVEVDGMNYGVNVETGEAFEFEEDGVVVRA